MTEPELGFTNPKVQRLRRLIGRRSSRSEEHAFVVEGRTLIVEAVAAGWELDSQFAAAGVDPVDAPAPRFTLAPGVAERVSDVEAPMGLLAIVRTREVDAAELLGRATFVVVADRIGEPGNLGTIIRSAEAAGCDGVVVTPGTVDETSPKVVRSSAGAVFHVPVVGASLADVGAAGLRSIGTSPHRGVSYVDADWNGRIAVVVGNEAAGIDDAQQLDEWVRIEHRGRTESLNVAMAATLLCFEAARRRA